MRLSCDPWDQSRGEELGEKVGRARYQGAAAPDHPLAFPPPTTEGLPGATVAWVPITLPPVLRAQVYLASCVTLSTPLATWNLNVLTLEMGTRPVSLGYWRGVGGFMQPSGQSVCHWPGFSPHRPLTGQGTLGSPSRSLCLRFHTCERGE